MGIVRLALAVTGDLPPLVAGAPVPRSSQRGPNPTSPLTSPMRFAPLARDHLGGLGVLLVRLVVAERCLRLRQIPTAERHSHLLSGVPDT